MSIAAQVYAEQLLPKGHGFPLWVPEPSTQLREACIGDVGYVYNGSFFRFFNVTMPREHPFNGRGVPHGFIPLAYDAEELLDRVDPYLPQVPICSQGVKRFDVNVKAGASASTAGAQVGYRFSCSSDKGGLLILGGPASQEVLRPNRAFVDYMYRNHDSWYEFAKQKGHAIAPEEIIMVRGWVKVSRWTVAAFVNETKGHESQLEVQMGSVGSLSMSAAISSATSMSVEHRSGPPATASVVDHENSREGEYLVAANSVPTEQRNQCVFLSRYKIRYRRFWLKKISAEAEALDDSKDPPDNGHYGASMRIEVDDESNNFTVEEEYTSLSFQDPTDALLEYILEHSDCDAAVASDQDIRALVELGLVGDIENIKHGLNLTMPNIVVSENQVASLSFPPSFFTPIHLPENGYETSAVAEPFEGSDDKTGTAFSDWHSDIGTSFSGFEDMDWKESDMNIFPFPVPKYDFASFLPGLSESYIPPSLSIPVTHGPELSHPSPTIAHSILPDASSQTLLYSSQEDNATSSRSADTASALKIAMRFPNYDLVIPQKVYRPSTQSHSRRYVTESISETAIMFYTKTPKGCGIPCRDALASKFSNLVGRDDRMFENRGPSVSIRLLWPGYSSWSRQIPTRDFRSPPQPITRSKLAKNVAKTIQRFINEMKEKPLEEDAYSQYRVGPRHIMIEDLDIIGLQQVSMGSWQVHLRLRRRP